MDSEAVAPPDRRAMAPPDSDDGAGAGSGISAHVSVDGGRWELPALTWSIGAGVIDEQWRIEAVDFGVGGCRRLWLAALTETVDLVWVEAVDFDSAGDWM